MIGIISDIHGNYTALQCVLSELRSCNVTKIYCLGDVVGYYTQINECCEALRENDISCILGNHDWYLAWNGFCARSKSVNDCLRYQREIITEDNLQWLRYLPLTITAENISMVHGGWSNPIDEYLEPTEDYFSHISGSVFASGHTHIARTEIYDNGILYCNPGSVGQPRDGDNRASYALWDGSEFNIRRVEYDYNEVGVLMEKAGFCGYYYGCLKNGSQRLCW